MLRSEDHRAVQDAVRSFVLMPQRTRQANDAW
jgi:hypothetical protein